MAFQIITKHTLLSKDNIIGLGTVDLKDNFHEITIDISYLKKIINSIEKLEIKNGQDEYLSLIWAENNPMIIGKLLGKKGSYKATGYMIAPFRLKERINK